MENIIKHNDFSKEEHIFLNIKIFHGTSLAVLLDSLGQTAPQTQDS